MNITSPVFAIVTPFDTDGNISEAPLRDYLQFLYDKGVRTIVTGGTTGEFSSLEFGERIELLRLARRYFKGTIINNVSSCCFKEANTLALQSEEADALLLLPPYYFNAREEGVASFFKNSLRGISKPTFLYNFPRHTQFAFSPDFAIRLRDKCPVICGLKDSGGDFDISLAFKAAGKNFKIFIGRDTMSFNALEHGLSGSVSGASNPFPEYLVSLTKAWQEGQKEEAKSIQESFDVWNKFRSGIGNEIALAKLILSLRLPGFPTSVRAPLTPLWEDHKESAFAYFDTVKHLFKFPNLTP